MGKTKESIEKVNVKTGEKLEGIVDARAKESRMYFIRGTEYGKASISPSEPVEAGSCGEWTITYTVGKESIEPEDGVLFLIPQGFSIPKYFEKPPAFIGQRGLMKQHSGPDKIVDPTAPGYVQAYVSREETQCEVFVDALKDNSRLGEAYHVFVTIKGKPLIKGDTVSLVYGKKIYASPGALTPYFSHKAPFLFKVFVYKQMDWKTVEKELVFPDFFAVMEKAKDFYGISNPPSLRVFSKKAARLIINAPSIVKINEPFTVKVTARDKYENVAENYKGKIQFENNKGIKLPANHTFTNVNQGIKHFSNKCFISESGVYRITAYDKKNNIGESNPVECMSENPGYKIFWGDIHCHSSESDGLGTLDQYFEYGKYAAALDFCASGDHKENGASLEMQSAARKHHIEGKFVTINAFEKRMDDGGDAVIYLKDFSEKYSTLTREAKTCAETIKALSTVKEGNVILVPHQHDEPIDCVAFNHPLVRLVEVYSCWGNSEKRGTSQKPLIHPGEADMAYVQEYLAKGLRLGMIGSGDEHAGHVGYGDWLRINSSQHNGLVAVYAKELTREAIWDALWNRRVYATTRERIILHFELNGHIMGEQVTINSNKTERKISASIEGTDIIEEVVLIKNNENYFVKKGNGKKAVSFNYTDTKTANKGDYYYIRVVQKNGELAWSSPVWIDVK